MPSLKKITLTEQKRSDIINAAAEEFRLIGYAGARIDKIAKRANVSKRTLYKHFASKELLFQAIIELVMAGYQESEIAEYNPDVPIKQQLIDAVTAYVAVISDDSNISLTRVVLSEFLRDQAASRKAFERSEMHHKPFADLIKLAMKDGKLREVDAEYATIQLSALVKAFLFWPKFLVGEKKPDKAQMHLIIEDSVAMFLSHYKV